MGTDLLGGGLSNRERQAQRRELRGQGQAIPMELQGRHKGHPARRTQARRQRFRQRHPGEQVPLELAGRFRGRQQDRPPRQPPGLGGPNVIPDPLLGTDPEGLQGIPGQGIPDLRLLLQGLLGGIGIPGGDRLGQRAQADIGLGGGGLGGPFGGLDPSMFMALLGGGLGRF